MKNIIAIDGPAGAGKSTIAKSLARELAYLYIDTGAMYRAVTYQVLQERADMADAERLARIAAAAQIDMRLIDGENHIFLNGRDLTQEIRLPEVSAAASRVSAVPQVRDQMLPKQRELAAKGRVVLDGRDIGTVVLPQADCKIYLTASLDERAERRYKELLAKDPYTELDAVRRDIAERDERDMNRAAAPLRQAEDAVYLDSTGLTIDEVLQKVRRLVEA